MVVYDRLVAHELLDLAPDDAELIDVGKAPGRIGSGPPGGIDQRPCQSEHGLGRVAGWSG